LTAVALVVLHVCGKDSVVIFIIIFVVSVAIIVIVVTVINVIVVVVAHPRHLLIRCCPHYSM
jgi:hypothetical protein